MKWKCLQNIRNNLCKGLIILILIYNIFRNKSNISKQMNEMHQIHIQSDYSKPQTLLDKIKVNQYLLNITLQQKKIYSNQKTTNFPIFPILRFSKNNQASPSYSERCREWEQSKSSSIYFIAKQMKKQSHDLTSQNRRRSSYFNQQSRDAKSKYSFKSVQQKIITRTVIIVSQTDSRSNKQKIFKKRILKRPSLIEQRRTQPLQNYKSSARKLSISPWETIDTSCI